MDDVRDEQKKANEHENTIEATRTEYVAAQRRFLDLPKNAKKAERVDALYDWNDRANTYFTSCISAFLGGKTASAQYRRNAGYAADWLKGVADHYEAVFANATALGKRRQDFEPSLLKFKELEELVREREPEAAKYLFKRFIEVGLPTYGFDAANRYSHRISLMLLIPALCFGTALLAILIALLFKKDDMSDFQRDLASKLFAVFAGFASGFMGGTALFTIEVPQNKSIRVFFSATAGIAVMAFIWSFAPYWFQPKVRGMTAPASTSISIPTSAVSPTPTQPALPPASGAPQAPSALEIACEVRVRLAADSQPTDPVFFHAGMKFVDSHRGQITEIRPPILPAGLQGIDMVAGRFVKIIETPQAAAPSRGPVPPSREYVYRIPISRHFAIDGSNEEVWAALSRVDAAELEVSVAPNQGRDARHANLKFPAISFVQLEFGGSLELNSLDARGSVLTVAKSQDGQGVWQLPDVGPTGVHVASATLQVDSASLNSFPLWKQFIGHH